MKDIKKNIFDTQPKRKKDKLNPYTIFKKTDVFDIPHCFVSFTDSQGNKICTSIDKAVYELLDSFELEDKSQMNAQERHHEQLALEDSELHSRASYKPDEPLERFIRRDYIISQIQRLSKVQKRRIMKYYFDDLSIKEIAQSEGCSIQAVDKSLRAARKKLSEYLSDMK